MNVLKSTITAFCSLTLKLTHGWDFRPLSPSLMVLIAHGMFVYEALMTLKIGCSLLSIVQRSKGQIFIMGSHLANNQNF